MRRLAGFAAWGVDTSRTTTATPTIARRRSGSPGCGTLARTGRPIAYAIYEWSSNESWTWAPEVANSWWSTGAFEEEWPSLRNNIRANLPFARHARLGAWNDPYILQVGNG